MSQNKSYSADGHVDKVVHDVKRLYKDKNAIINRTIGTLRISSGPVGGSNRKVSNMLPVWRDPRFPS